MNLKKLASLALASLMGLNVFTAIPKVSAQDISSETVSEKTDLENNNSELVEKIKKEIERNEDLKKESEKLKEELEKCKEKNKSLESKSPSFISSVFGFFGKLLRKVVGGATVTAGFAFAAFLGLTGTDAGNKFLTNVLTNTVRYNITNPANADHLAQDREETTLYISAGIGIIPGLLTAVLL